VKEAARQRRSRQLRRSGGERQWARGPAAPVNQGRGERESKQQERARRRCSLGRGKDGEGGRGFKSGAVTAPGNLGRTIGKEGVGRGALRRVGCANGGGAKTGHGGDGQLLLKEGAAGSRGEGGSDQRPRGCRESGGFPDSAQRR
jgi:hypothetical protein